MVTKQTQRRGRQTVRDGQTPRERAIEAYDSASRQAAGSIGEGSPSRARRRACRGRRARRADPTTRKERELLGPVAGRIKDKANDAVTAAKDAGQARLDELGLTRDKSSETLRSLLEGAGDAAKASAEATVTAIRGTKD